MTDQILSPRDAALLADGVYGIRTIDAVRAGFAERGVSVATAWNLDTASVAHAGSGAVFRPRSGFAVVLDGSGPWQGHKAIAFRGTVTRWDWLSNFNVAVDRGPDTLWVPAGFNRIYSDLREVIAGSLRGHNGPVHVVGHSLGGALAQLAALDLAAARKGTTRLYTFGAPRAVFHTDQQRALKNIGAENIFRVCHSGDPVPLLPLWPFAHVSLPAHEVWVGSAALPIHKGAHEMRESYADLVSQRTWGDLRAASGTSRARREVGYWLDVAERNVQAPGSALGFWALGKAISAILMIVERSVGSLLVGSATVIDGLASLLMNAANLSAEIGTALLRVIELAWRWLGRAALSGVRLTMAFVRYVLELLLRPIAGMARSALERLA